MIKNRYVTVETYAKLCGVGKHAIYQRLYKSDEGVYNEGDESFLEKTLLAEAEGEFIDTVLFPPKRVSRGRKFKNKK